MDDLRRTTAAAVASSFALVTLLFASVTNAATQPKAKIGLLIGFVVILVLTYSTIFQWMRCAREYIDYTVDRKLAAGRENRKQE